MRSWLRVLSYAVGIALVVGMVAYLIFFERDVVNRLGRISVGYLALLFGVSVGVSLAHGLQFNEVGKIYGLRMKFTEWFGLTVTNRMLNYILPMKGGSIARAAYMKRQFSLPYTSYGSLLASSQLITTAIAASFGICFLFLWWLSADAISLELVGFLTLVVVGCVAIYLLVGVLDFGRARPKFLGRRLQVFAEGFRQWGSHRRAARRFAFTSVIWIMMGALRLMVSFYAIGAPVGFVRAIIIQMVVVSLSVPLTPGNVGIKEGLTTLAGGLLGIQPSIALLASLIDRGISLISTIILGSAFSRSLVAEMRGTTSHGEE